MSWKNFLLYSGFSICLFLLMENIHAETPENEEYSGWEYISPEIKEKCDSVKNILEAIPDTIDAKTLEALKECDAEALYYGFTQRPDYVKARHCAQTIKDYGILMMLYANGKGVSRNLDIAIHYACKYGGAPAELEGRVKHLMELKKIGEQPKPFDICDDITSGYMGGVCASIKERFQEEIYEKQHTFLMKHWTGEERKSFEKIQKAFDLYVEARVDEIDVRGTARASFQIEERISLKNRFLKTLKECAQGKIPTFTPAHYKEADKQLNLLYKQTQNKKYPHMSGISPEGIKQTQRAWLKYRDTWVTFGRLKCPNISEESWKTLITKERIKELQSLEEMESDE